MRVLITRAPDDAEPLAEALRERGLEPVLAPLLEIVHAVGPPLDLNGVQTILATSANGVRAFAERDDRRDLPLYAVGRATAQAAREAGFRCIATAGGDVSTFADLVRRTLNPARGTLLHVAGSILAGDLAGELRKAGYVYRRETLYQARAASRLPPSAAIGLRAGTIDGVTLYSPRTAGIFFDLVGKEGLEPCCSTLTAFCLSEAVAARCTGVALRAVVVPVRPQEDVLLDAIVGTARRLRSG